MAKHRVSAAPPPPVASPPRFALAPLLLLLAGSGCAALIYEIVWFQLLQLVIGSSAVSLGLLLASYMGGLCLGSAAFARLVPREVTGRYAPRRVYAMLELGIGAFGIMALFGVPLISGLSLMVPQAGLAGIVCRGFIAVLCMLPPALLMGATYPAAARWAEDRTPAPRSESAGGSVTRLGLLYAANTCGAVAGCVLAGFYLLRIHDLGVATYAAASINAAMALAAFLLPGRAAATAAAAGPKELTRTTEPRATAGPSQVSDPLESLAGPLRVSGAAWIYLSIGLSGLGALGAEVVWTRLLSPLLGVTVYAFSIILAVFLAGLWAGSAVGSLFASRFRETRPSWDPRFALAVCQILIVAACAWTVQALAYSLPYWPVDPILSTLIKREGAIDFWRNFELDAIRCAWAILPPVLLWGASFPLALACAARKDQDPARLTGEVYAANTAGAIAGALLFSLLLIPFVGTAGSQKVLVWVSAGAAMAALGPLMFTAGSRRRFAGGLALVVVLAWACTSIVPGLQWQLIAYGRRVASSRQADRLRSAQDHDIPLFVGEGTNSSVAIVQRGDQRIFYVNGKSEASTAPVDMRLQRMLGHLPALIHPNPHSVLVVGFGAGVTAGSFVPYPEVQRITICELEPLVPPASGNYFANENDRVIADRRTSIVYDDARHYIQTTPEKFDIITMDPNHPSVEGASALYSREYYNLVKDHLNPGGVAAQRLSLSETDEESVKTELATFFAVFPSATVWSTYRDGDGYDMVLLGQTEPAAIDINAIGRRLKTPGYAGVVQSLAEPGFPTATDLLAAYAGRAPDLQAMLEGAQINEDVSMRLQYMAGMAVNSKEAANMYHQILSHREFPEGLFTGTAEQVEGLRELLQRPALTF